MAIITISRVSGSLGDELGSYLKDKLQATIINREIALGSFFASYPDDVKTKLSESSKHFNLPIPDSDLTYKDIVIKNIQAIYDDARSKEYNLIIMGLGGACYFHNNPDVINIRITASVETRIRRLSRRYNITSEEANSILRISDRKHKRFVSELWGKDISSSELFDISFNSDMLSVEEMADSVIALIKKHELRTKIEDEASRDSSINHQTETPVFKNQTEEDFARILNAYNIEWLYEPKTFPIEWDAEGNVRMAFSPDFYLPKFDLYLELTTMDQKYVTKKNKKLRMVKELYPGTNIRIVYKKDYYELIDRLKFLGISEGSS